MRETDAANERFEQHEASIEELEVWRDQMGSVLSGGGGRAAAGEDE